MFVNLTYSVVATQLKTLVTKNKKEVFMNIKAKLQKSATLVSTVCGSLLVVSSVASAVPSKVNPCPGIYYEEPYNSTRIVPQGCPANSATQSVQPSTIPNRITPDQEVLTKPSTAAPVGVIQPPLPETRSNAIACVMTMDGKVNVKLKNNTNAFISFEALGYTGRRFLLAGEEIVLQKLATPVTISAVRQDKGLLEVTAVPNSEPGMLELSLNESKTLSDNLGAIRIQQDGQVFLN